jgi:hypothetical protein
MAIDDTTLKAEVRAITDYDAGILDSDSLQELVEIAKRELESNKNASDLDFYGDIRAERTLFWLTCIFLKVKAGEIDGGSFSISELDVESEDGSNSMFFDNFWRNYHSIGEGRPRGHLKGQRADRTYEYDNSATDPL